MKAQSQILPSGDYQHYPGATLMPLPEVRRLAAALLGVAATMHGNGYLHGDVTADNVLVERAAAADGGSSSFVVIDMGLAQQVNPATGLLRKRPAGFSLQTAPPELFEHAMLGKQASAPVGLPADCFSIGVVVAQAAALHSMPGGALGLYVQGKQALPPQTPPSLAALLAGLTAQRPEDRVTAEAALAHPFFRE